MELDSNCTLASAVVAVLYALQMVVWQPWSFCGQICGSETHGEVDQTGKKGLQIVSEDQVVGVVLLQLEVKFLTTENYSTVVSTVFWLLLFDFETKP